MSATGTTVPVTRPVLLWHPDRDESRVEEGLGPAAAFLGVAADVVLAAIDSGNLVGGWFVDWASPGR